MSLFSDIAIVWSKYGTQILSGIGNTVLISIIGTLIGLVIGLFNGVIRTMPEAKSAFVQGVMKVVNFIISAYVEVFRGTPMMVQAMIIYWGYAYMNGGASLPLIPAGIAIVSINTGAYITEIVRGGIISIDKGQFEGAMSIGMSHFSLLHINEFGIIASESVEFFVRTAFRHVAVIQYHDLVTVTDRRKTVSDDDAGDAAVFDRLDDFMFHFRIQSGCGFIHDDDRRILT